MIEYGDDPSEEDRFGTRGNNGLRIDGEEVERARKVLLVVISEADWDKRRYLRDLRALRELIFHKLLIVFGFWILGFLSWFFLWLGFWVFDYAIIFENG